MNINQTVLVSVMSFQVLLLWNRYYKTFLILISLYFSLLFSIWKSILIWTRDNVNNQRFKDTVDDLLGDPTEERVRRTSGSLWHLVTGNSINFRVKSAIKEDTDKQRLCIITQEDIQIGDSILVLSCGHFGLKTAMDTWLRDHTTCPVCRGKSYSS